MTSLKEIGICYKCKKTYSIRAIKSHINKCNKEVQYSNIELYNPHKKVDVLKQQISVMMYINSFCEDKINNPYNVDITPFLDEYDSVLMNKKLLDKYKLSREQVIHTLQGSIVPRTPYCSLMVV